MDKYDYFTNIEPTVIEQGITIIAIVNTIFTNDV
jgi:hypothetical protein